MNRGNFFFENGRSLKPTRAVPLIKKIDNFVFNDCSFVRIIKGSKKKMEFNTKKREHLIYWQKDVQNVKEMKNFIRFS